MVQLFSIDEIKGNLITPGYSKKLTRDFLKGHPTLVVDTRHFGTGFTSRLLEAIGDIDDQATGLLVQCDNFHALALTQTRYRERVKCIYIDPPYNTDAGPIDYKNGYRSSSWISLIANRLELARQFLSDDGVLCVTIDDYQVHELASLIEQEFGRDKYLGTAAIRNNPSGRSTVRGLSVCHEYAFFESPDIKVGRSQRTGTTCAVSPAHLSSSNNHRLNTLRRLLAAAEQAPQPERGLRRRPSTEARKYCSGRSQKREFRHNSVHEYAFFYTNGHASLDRLPRTEKQLARFSKEDDSYIDWRNFRKDGGIVTHRAERPKQYYPIYVALLTSKWVEVQVGATRSYAIWAVTA